MEVAGRHLPAPAPIEAYGNGGFRFGGLSHRGSLLCLPAGIWASDVKALADVDEAALALALRPETVIDQFLIGTGREPAVAPRPLRDLFRARRIAIEVMTTGAAVHTYNILLGERRRFGALLIAVGDG